MPNSISTCFLTLAACAAISACGGGSVDSGASSLVGADETANGASEARSSVAGVTTSATTIDTATSTTTGSVKAASIASAAAATAAWQTVAAENSPFTTASAQIVRYGAGSSWISKSVSGTGLCSNAFFGKDPAYGVVKSCQVQTVAINWTNLAVENSPFNVGTAQTVRFGANATWKVATLTGAGTCSNAFFGGDPLPGVVKLCQYDPDSGAPLWTKAAAENGSLNLKQNEIVRYGSGALWIVKTVAAGAAICSNAFFGTDPAPGVVKECDFESGPVPVIVATPPAAPVVASIVLPLVTAAAMGTPVQLSASVLDAQGKAVPGAAVAWSIADPTIASVSTGGLATALRPGYTTVTASSGGKSTTETLTARGPTPIPTRSQYVGTNLGGLAYYGTNFPFANLVKSGSGWKSDNGAAFPSTSADGYPTSLAPGQHAQTAVTWTNTHYPAGKYTLLWDGDGTMSFPWGNVTIDSSAPNRIVVEPQNLSQAIELRIDSTNAANPVRNVRFLLPGTEDTYAAIAFNPDFLQKTAPFSLLRFMDWGGTNGSPVVEWADRSLPTNATYATSKGVPIEVMIDLANTLHVDPWFCIPHMASDDYVLQFAKLLHARLDPTLRPHIEYSNEVWNTGFAQTTWASAQSDAQGLARPYGTPSLFYAKRAVQMFKIMQQAYGATDSHRLVRVIAGQAAWTQFLENALAYSDTAANADVMAIAPYFSAPSADNPANATATLALTPSQVVDQMLVSIRGNIKSWMTTNAALASKYHLTMKAYESGPSDTAFSFPSNQQAAMVSLFSAANNDPKMRAAYSEYYGQWKALGGATMNQYSDIGPWSIYGFWGALEYVTESPSASPKYQGLIDFITANPTLPTETVLSSTPSSQ